MDEDWRTYFNPMAPNPSSKPQEMIDRGKMDQSNNTMEIKNQECVVNEID